MSAYLDGEVDAATAAEVVDHLRRCWACSGDAEVMRLVKQSLRNLGSRDVLALLRLRRGTHGVQ